MAQTILVRIGTFLFHSFLQVALQPQNSEPVPSQDSIYVSLGQVHERYANEIDDHNFDEQYNFLECQQDQNFLHSLAESFGWNLAQRMTILRFQHSVTIPNANLPVDDDYDSTGNENQFSKGWIDCRIFSGDGAIWELKSPTNQNGGERSLTQQNREQLLAYWNSLYSNDSLARPRYLVLTNFRTFEIWDSNQGLPTYSEPYRTFRLEEIAENIDAFPYFHQQNPNAAINDTQLIISDVSATQLATLYHSLIESDIDSNRALWFTTQIALLMYVEDLTNMNGEHYLERSSNGRGPLLEVLLDIGQNPDHIDRLYNLLRALGMENPVGEFSEVPMISNYWFSLENTNPIPLTENQIELLINSASFDWSAINPIIFGAIVESCYTDEQRLGGGIHFTSEDDVLRIVRPLITEPWMRRLEGLFQAITPQSHPVNWTQRRVEVVVDALTDLFNFRVLEPACGCGNFLYIAYQELKDIENRLIQLMREIPGQEGYVPSISLTPINMIGYEIQPWSAQIARLIMSIGYCRTQIEFQWGNPFPLTNDLARIIQCDSLMDGDQIRTWHDAEVIIGNPPFGGSRLLRQRGLISDTFRAAFEGIVPNFNIDYVGYWFVLAQRSLLENDCLRAFGFISTKSIVQRQSRTVLAQIIDQGSEIQLAHNSRTWVGTAGQNISIVCVGRQGDDWITPIRLATDHDGELQEVQTINEYLLDWDRGVLEEPLDGQRDYSSQGVKCILSTVTITEEQAQQMLSSSNGQDGPPNSDVVVPYIPNWSLGGSTRDYGWIINFGVMEEAQAIQYIAPYTYLYNEGRREAIINRCTEGHDDYSVYYHRDDHDDVWWRIKEHRQALWNRLAGRETIFIKSQTGAGGHHWEEIPNGHIPDGGYYVMALPQRWMMGILLSSIHRNWCSLTSGEFMGSTTTWRPKDVLYGFPFPNNPTSEQTSNVEFAMNQYYERINDLLAIPNFGDLNAVLDSPTLEPYRVAIDQAVYPLYGLDIDDGVVSREQLLEIKRGALNIQNSSINSLSIMDGVGTILINRMRDVHGWHTIQELMVAGVENLLEVDGVSSQLAQRIIEHIVELGN